MARSRRTTVVSRFSWGWYNTSATSDGSAGRGSTHSRPSPHWGRSTVGGPTAEGSRPTSGPGLRISNSGEHLSHPLGGLDQPRRADRQRDAEKSLPPGPEPASGERHHAHLRERAARKRGGCDDLGQRYPHV